MKIKDEAVETGAAETSVADHVRSMLHLMERGARVNLTDIPGDTTFLSSNFSGETAKEMAAHIKAALSPAPVGVTDEVSKNSWRSNEDIAIELMDAASDADAAGRVADARFMRIAAGRLEALASHEPAPTDIDKLGAALDTQIDVAERSAKEWRDRATSITADPQEGLSEAGEVVAWRAPINPYGQRGFTYTSTEDELVRFGHHQREPLVRQSALTACQQEVERLQGMLSGTNKVITGMSRDFTAAHDAYEARILELETELILRARKLHRLTDALTPSRETKAAYMGEFHMGITLMHNGDEDHRRVMIPWTSIKEIMAVIRARAVLGGQSNE